MTVFIAPRRRAVAALVCAFAATLAGCASRSLNLPPVVDRSGELRSRTASGTTVAPDGRAPSISSAAQPAPLDSSSAAISSPIGNERIEQRPLDQAPLSSTTVVPAPATAVGNTAPIKTGPLGIKRPYSDAAYADLSKPDASASSTLIASAAPSSVAPSASAPASTSLSPQGGVAWGWPASGKVTSTFTSGKNNGIDIVGNAGDPVVAAADGKVTFAGTGVRGYGNFVIVRHSPELLSVYAHNRTNLVKEGATVTKGQRIAEMGSSDASSVGLHFEIRSDSKPIDPMKYLPER